eukprot:GFUD01070337.1.p1 GENE.GFUD01070337.1~~GFUD01070337.1.p1  ORF type:complete len:369 (+),score=100.18 GFUD01070337.1:290-1396(+)
MNRSRKQISLRTLCGCCRPGSSPEPEISRPKRRMRGKKPDVVFELLLLGADGSGKSTFIRQMQIIHGQGFNDCERAELIPDIHKNIVDAMEVLLEQMKDTKLNIPLEDPAKHRDMEMFANKEQPMDVRLGCVSRLWSDQGVQDCFRRRGEYSTTHPLNVSTQYFLNAIADRINEAGYLPITEDIIRVRRNTIGVIQYEFVLTDIQFKIIDVGGEREERVRWIDFLAAKITCVIFLGAIDEYDTKFIAEDGEEKNRLKESIELFKKIQNFQWLAHTTFILFLNKVDVFKEKLQTSDMVNHFNDYKGFRKEYASNLAFVKKKFHEESTPRRPRMIYTHETCATDTAGMKFVFEAVRDTILQLNLRQYNLV